MGIFWVGSGVTILHGIEYLTNLPTEPINYGKKKKIDKKIKIKKN